MSQAALTARVATSRLSTLAGFGSIVSDDDPSEVAARSETDAISTTATAA